MALTDRDGDVVNDYEYDIFGAMCDSSGALDNFGSGRARRYLRSNRHRK